MSALTRDKRYTVRKEYCGYAQARFVARFCGEWLGCSESRGGALALVRAHQASRTVKS